MSNVTGKIIALGGGGGASEAEVEELRSAITILEPSASASDVGKYLKAKTVADGKVSEYEFDNPTIDPEDIAEAVDDWLDEHPEATTTVQDGSITGAKLATDLNGTNGAVISGIDLSWELGVINSSSGKDSSSTSRIRTVGYIDINDFVSMTVTNDKRIGIYAYNELHNYIGYTDWLAKNIGKTKAELRTTFSGIAFFRVCMMASSASDGQYCTMEAATANKDTSKWRESVTSKCDTKYRFDGKFLVIAYSHVQGGPPINTKEHFKYCAEQGYDGLKTDVRITSDNKIILCHDAGYTLDANGRISANYNASNSTAIHDLTYDQCVALEYADQYNGQYLHPCGIDDFMVICKRTGLVPFITIRDEYVSDVASAVASAITKYAMTRNCIINSFTHSSLLAVRALVPDAFLSLVFSPYNSSLRSQSLGYAMSYKDYALSLFYHDDTNTLATMLANSDVLNYINTCIESGVRIFGAQSTTDEELDTITGLGFDGSQHKGAMT